MFPVPSLSEMKARYKEGSSVENTSQVFNLKKKVCNTYKNMPHLNQELEEGRELNSGDHVKIR